MKIPIVLSLLFSFVSCNLFAQSENFQITSDSSSKKTSLHLDFVKTNPRTLHNKSKQKINEASPDEKEGILIGAILGAAAGVGAGALLSNFSMEPHSHNEYSFGTAVVCGVVGAFVGGIIGGLASK